MLNNLGLGFIFTAKDLASETMNRLGRSFEQFEKKASTTLTRTQLALRQFAIGAGIALAGVVGFGASLGLANASGVFTQEMAKVIAISDISANSVEANALSVKALDAAMKTQFSPAEAAKGLQNFASQGFNARQQMDSLTPALRLAQAGMISVEDSSAAMTSALKVFSLESGQAALVTDKLLKVANITSLQAGDLSLALGTVARGASLTKQNLDEMLISMGLVRNTGVDVSVAASSVSSALIFMAKNAGEFKKLGVEVTNADGSFRDFIDVAMETDAILSEKFPNAAERAAKAVDLFERFGTTAFQAVTSQIKHGIQDASGNILKGADAVNYLRKTMDGAAGTAEVFEAKILGTFAGQKQILEGVIQTLAVAVGAPFERAFKPIVSAIRDFFEGLVAFVMSIPEPVMNFFANIAIGASVLLTVLGGLIALKGGIMLLSSAFGFLGISFASALTPILVVGAALAAVGLAVAAFNSDAKQSTGSTLDFFKGAFERVKLFFQGLTQYFRDGALSGPILDELNKAENQGVKNFLGKVLDFGARMEKFFEGVGRGFDAFVKKSEPAFVALQVALQDLGDSLGFVTGDFEEAADGSMNKFEKSGASLGATLGELAILIIQTLTFAIRVIDSFMEVLDSLGLTIGDVIKIWVLYKATVWAVKGTMLLFETATWAVAAAQKGLAAASVASQTKIGNFAGALSNANGKLTTMLGSTAGRVGLAGLIVTVGLAAYEIGGMVDAMNGNNASNAFASWIGNLTGLNDEIKKLNDLNNGLNADRGQMSEVGSLGHLQEIAESQGMSLDQYRTKRIEELQSQGYDAYIGQDGTVQVDTSRSQAYSKEQYAVEGRAGATPVAEFSSKEEENAAIDRAIMHSDDAMNALMTSMENRPIALTVKLDGEQLAAAVERTDRAGKARAFSPMPVEE